MTLTPSLARSLLCAVTLLHIPLLHGQSLEPDGMVILRDLSDRVGPRLTGSDGDAKAREWAIRQMRTAGLRNVHAEPWMLSSAWTRGTARARLVSPFALDLAVLSYGWAGSTKGELEGDVVIVDRGALVAAGRGSGNWKGKVLLLLPRDAAHYDSLRGLAELPAFLKAAEAAQAIAVIAPDSRPGVLLPHTGPISFPFHRSGMATLDLADEQVKLLARLVGGGAAVRVSVDVRNQFREGPVESNNLVGEIAGSGRSEEVVLLGAHLDSWDIGTGSVDDGFGVAAVLAAARTIAADEKAPRRTIRVVLFTGEEQGLLGSRHYVEQHQSELQNLVCAVVIDWGAGAMKSIPVAGHAELEAPLREILGSTLRLNGVRPGNGYLTYTDAFPFTLAGVPGLAAYQDSPAYAQIGHSAADTLDKVQASAMEQVSGALAALARGIADSPTRFGRRFTPQETAASLEDLRVGLQLLGLWPF